MTISITYSDKINEKKSYHKTLDKYDLIILRQALLCQMKRKGITLSPEFSKIYTQRLANLYEIIDSNMTSDLLIENR